MEHNLRIKSWDDYGITKHRCRELKEFCLQYNEKKSKINHDISIRSQPDELAIRNVIYQRDCELIEQAAIMASSEYYQYIIKSVINGLTYEDIEYDDEFGRIPIGKTDFYALRRYFYHVLDNLKLGTNRATFNDII